MPLKYKNNIFWIFKNVTSRNYAKIDGDLRNVRFKYHDGYAVNHMKPTRSTRQSCDILVGTADDELNLERNGKMNGMKSLYAGSVL